MIVNMLCDLIETTRAQVANQMDTPGFAGHFCLEQNAFS
jgi:hypothetical protein